ncbi:MAG: type II toxin-antitoxin system RelE/ParE family toxin [Pseudomonadota bacterium]
MIRVEWLEDAKADLQRLYNFICPHSPRAAAKAVSAIIDRVGDLQDFPELGRPWDADLAYRELTVVFGARGYVVRYRLIEDRAIIIRIWHGLEDRNA